VLVTVHDTSGENGQGADAAAPVFQKIMTEALRMLDVPKDIPEEEIANKKPAKEKPGEFDDVAIAGLGEPSIMDDDPTVQELLAEQLRPEPGAGEIPAAKPGAASPAVASGTAASATASEASGTAVVAAAAPDAVVKPAVPEGPMAPDFRGKSMRDVIEESAARGLDVIIEGSGVARAQAPLPGSPLRRGQQIRIVFTR
jgi:cell division protein FtsI (penicillin-binding protein 3)